MSAKKSSSTQEVWNSARKRFKLSETHVRMAKELGLNPKKLGKIANHKQESWKVALPDFIEDLYKKVEKLSL